MWVSKKEYRELHEQNTEIAATALRDVGHLKGLEARLEIENARLRADIDWFKHRLNQVERERGQLIQAAIGVKVSVPEFVTAQEQPTEALNPVFNPFVDQGGDDTEPATMGGGYLNLPGMAKS